VSAATGTARWDPDALARLEDERDLLLRELREVDAQHAAGELDRPRYEALRDDLTARAADAIARVERGRVARPAPTRRPWARGLAVAGIAVAAAAAGLLLADQLAPRVPPAPPAADEADASARISRLAAVVQERPEDVPARLALARLLIEAQDLEAARGQFDEVVALDPEHAEALAYAGWLTTLGGDVDGGLERLDRAVAADPSYPDARAFRGLTLMRAGEDAAAVDDLRRYLELAPTGPLVADVRAVVERLGGGP
jgi:tetratricopeptide (TPR) repeat protein